MKLRVLTMLAAVTLTASMAMGCSSGNSTETTAAPTGTTVAAESAAPAETEKADKYKIVLITIDSMDQHWVNMDKGCKAAAEELGNVDYSWMAPDVKDDAKQIECINNAVAGGANAILLAANGPDAVTSALKEAEEAGVKIVQVDSFANYPCVQQLGTDNVSAGKTAGEQVLAKLTENGVTSGNIGVVSVNAATTSTVNREEGFRAAFKDTDFKILPTQYGEGDAAKSKDLAANFISDGVVALFGANEGSTVGVGNAVKEDGNKIVAAGMDKSDSVLQLIKEGSLICTMAQNPDVMGKGGIEAAVKALNGETVTPDYVDTGVSILDAAAVK
ncbi:MAG: substrate-binding domain-containing protein [Lachnospiraceae bacterium]